MINLSDLVLNIEGLKNLFNNYLNNLKYIGYNGLQWVLDKLGLVTKQNENNFPSNSNTGGFSRDQIERIKELHRENAEHAEILRELKRLENKNSSWWSYLSWLGSSTDSWIPNWLWVSQ